jgi:SnoaL-like domain
MAFRLKTGLISTSWARSMPFAAIPQQFGAIAELFVEDGVWDESVVGLPVGEGRSMIDEVFRSFAGSGLEYVFHVNCNHRLTEFDGQTARGTCHVYAFSRTDGAHMTVAGYYDDEYAKVDGAWRFQRRQLVEIAPSAVLAERAGCP